MGASLLCDYPRLPPHADAIRVEESEQQYETNPIWPPAKSGRAEQAAAGTQDKYR